MGNTISSANELGAAAQPPASENTILNNLINQGYTAIGTLTPIQIGSSKGLQAPPSSPARTPVRF